MRHIVLVTTLEAVLESPDVAAKSLVAALLVSNDVRRDTEFVIVLEDKALVFMGRSIRQLRADERSAFGIIEKALRSRKRFPHTGVAVEAVQDPVKYIRRFPRPRLLAASRSGLPAVPSPPFTLVVPWKRDLARQWDEDATGSLMYPHHTIAVAHWIADVHSEGRRPPIR